MPTHVLRRCSAVLLIALTSSMLVAAAEGRASASISTKVKTVPVGDISIGYREFGHGPPLVLIQGSGAAMDVWDTRILKLLAHHHRVVIFDNRGVGFSTDDPAVPMTMQLLADDTAGLIRKLHLGHPDVLGWSLGGFIAEELAVRHPDLVHRLILISSDPGGKRAVRADPSILALDARVTLGQATLDEILSLLFPPEGLAAGLVWLNRYFAQPGCCELVPYETGLRQLGAEDAWYLRGGGVWRALADIRSRTLVMAGREDIDVPVRNTVLLAGKIPDATRRIFAGAGHGLPLQRPFAVARAVNGFLATGKN
jgi:Predicted hydrolases or acyltransferases (alpha/beta hydrolase superfamily)